jgi:hypothetical protein
LEGLAEEIRYRIREPRTRDRFAGKKTTALKMRLKTNQKKSNTQRDPKVRKTRKKTEQDGDGWG